MTTKDIADRLVTFCRHGRFEEAQKTIFADDAVSIEAQATPVFAKETKGLHAIFEKGKTFEGMVETMHALAVSDPVVADNSFACTMRMDLTMKGRGRFDMTELCVYEVRNGKIVSERFLM